MKIIAHAGNAKFIVEMERTEILDLCGIGWSERSKVDIGATLKAGENADKIREIRAQRKECMQAAENLRALASLLEQSLHGFLPEPSTESEAQA